MKNLSAYQAFLKTGLKSAEGVQLIELDGGKLAYVFSEHGFSNDGQTVAMDLHGNLVEGHAMTKICILMSGNGFK